MFEEIMKLLGIDKLDESQIASAKTKINEMIDVKARERAESLVKEQSERLIEEYEAKFEEYKNDVTSKFSNFVDTVLEEELKLPEKIVEYAKKGELYDDVIQTLKVRLAIDEGMLNDEVKSLLREAKDEIVSLKGKLNEAIGKSMKVEEDAKLMAAHLYLRKKCDGLTEAQRTKVVNLLGDITEKEEIDRKFDIVVNNALSELETPDSNTGLAPGTEEPKPEAATIDCICPGCGMHATTKGACSTTPCPSCQAMMKDADSFTPAAEMGQGSLEVPAQAEPVKESDDPFKKYIQGVVQVLREGK
jgi:hypothetical protein